MPQVKTARAPDQPAPPLGLLAAAIREYVSAEQLGENNRRRDDLSRRVFELCETCRRKWYEHEMRCDDGTSACVVWTYSTIRVQRKNREGEDAGGSLKPRCHSDPPSELDRDLDDIRDDVTRARLETAFGERMPDENGRPLPAPAIDRLLAIADRIEPQRGRPREPDSSAGLLSVADLADRHELTPKQTEALRKRLDRWRAKHFDGKWVETTASDRGPRDPKYLYDPKAVVPIIEAIKKRRVETSV